MKKVIAVVPARAGSKGLPGKNLKLLGGHPLLAYSIGAALQSPCIARVIVSTDCAKTAAVARAYGAETPFLRPAGISQDSSLDIEFLKHALDFLKDAENYVPGAVVLLRPTSPLRRPGLIDRAIQKFFATAGAESLRSIVRAPATPFKMWFQDGDFLRPAMMTAGAGDEPFNRSRQSLPQAWLQAGAVDVIAAEVILRGSASGRKIVHLEIPDSDFCDIDDRESFDLAERKLADGGYIRPRPMAPTLEL